MRAVTATELAAMQSAQEALQPTSCTVRAPGTATGDGAGGVTRGDPTNTSTTCRAVPSTGVELELAEKLSVAKPWTVTLAYGATIDESYQVIVGSRTLGVVAVLNGGSYSTAVRVLCQEAV